MTQDTVDLKHLFENLQKRGLEGKSFTQMTKPEILYVCSMVLVSAAEASGQQSAREDVDIPF